MIRELDRLWFRLLLAAHRWLVRRGLAHCEREKERRFWRFMDRQNHLLN